MTVIAINRFTYSVTIILSVRYLEPPALILPGTVQNSFIISRLRSRWPRVGIVVRGDSGFSRDYIMKWCEDHGVKYILGFSKKPSVEQDDKASAQSCPQEVRGGRKVSQSVYFILVHDQEQKLE
ncbi:hypothetical protein CSA37_10805 [Candidatus Fermentibacteria bacterium]|nr:MAG: hypothetical protein CSA37_10805 [Candidatus Fermentibacteria bacterium]